MHINLPYCFLHHEVSTYHNNVQHFYEAELEPDDCCVICRLQFESTKPFINDILEYTTKKFFRLG